MMIARFQNASKLLWFATLALIVAVPGAHGDDGKTSRSALSADVVAAAQKRTVKLYGAGVGRTVGYATGILVSPKGHIVTANGVILSGERIRVVMSDGKVHYAVVVRRDESIQTALLKIDADTPDHFSLSDTRPVATGDWVLSISNMFKVANGDEPLTVNRGIVSGVTKVQGMRGTQDVRYDGDAILIDAITSNPGGPGGAVINTDGRLVGMIGRLLESKRTRARLNYAVPVAMLARLVAGKTVIAKKQPMKQSGGPVELGIRLFRLGGKRGPAYVDRVLPGSPAARAGLRSDDLILSLAGTRIRNVAAFEEALKQVAFDKPVELLVKRKQQLLKLQLVPAAVSKKP